MNGNSDEENDLEQDSSHFEGDLHVWTRHFLPGIIKRIYGLQSKQLLEIFSCLFFIPLSDMENHLKQNDLGRNQVTEGGNRHRNLLNRPIL